MPTSPTRRAERWRAPRGRRGIALGIVALHALLIAALVLRPAPRLRDAAPPARMATVRLLGAPAPPPPVAPAAPAPPRRSGPPRHPAPITPPRDSAARATPAAESAATAPETITATASPASAPPAAAPASAAPIEIPRGIARGTLRHPALDDPRANSAPLPAGERFARDIGADDRLREEWRGEGRHRVRQGTGCLDVQVARDAQIDPFNQAVRPTPRQVGDCRER